MAIIRVRKNRRLMFISSYPYSYNLDWSQFKYIEDDKKMNGNKKKNEQISYQNF